jgi:hypothetical protein
MRTRLGALKGVMCKIDHEFLISLPAEFASRDHFLRTRSGVLRGVMCYVNLKSDYEDTGF